MDLEKTNNNDNSVFEKQQHVEEGSQNFSFDELAIAKEISSFDSSYDEMESVSTSFSPQQKILIEIKEKEESVEAVAPRRVLVTFDDQPVEEAVSAVSPVVTFAVENQEEQIATSPLEESLKAEAAEDASLTQSAPVLDENSNAKVSDVASEIQLQVQDETMFLEGAQVAEELSSENLIEESPEVDVAQISFSEVGEIENHDLVESSEIKGEANTEDEEKVEEIPHLQLSEEDWKEKIQSIPQRLAFKIGDVTDIIGVKQYVLRYWESEFEALKPQKSKFNQRIYSRRDVETALMIKKLLYQDRFSIEGARKALKDLKKQVKQEKAIDKAMDHAAKKHELAIEDLHELLAEIQKVQKLFV